MTTPKQIVDKWGSLYNMRRAVETAREDAAVLRPADAEGAALLDEYAEICHRIKAYLDERLG